MLLADSNAFNGARPLRGRDIGFGRVLTCNLTSPMIVSA
jgi:hypothetical protein